MASESMYEGERRTFPYTMTYGPSWSVEADRGNPIKKSAVSRVRFYIRRRKDEDPFLTLADRTALDVDTPDEIEWVDVDQGTIKIKLAGLTSAKVARDAIFELRVDWVAGGYTILDRDTIDILDSVTV